MTAESAGNYIRVLYCEAEKGVDAKTILLHTIRLPLSALVKRGCKEAVRLENTRAT